ncbi:MAG: 2Fe-2S iron-sulfur cluster-binding protein [Acidobacteriota bacterium]|nr:2Fe-2S iron-sulfur cluster-binding protein [Pyrinomonadaceae bacterium]MDW8303391.1 2Fe-2S iron-sulfur cluster-binding protein [Acidobacteriota bacterium]
MKFEEFLNRFEEEEWLDAVEKLLPEIHEVDRNAVQIWFRFFPLKLFRYLQKFEDKDAIVRKFLLRGNFELKNQIDSSHRFFYGHRFWKQVKEATIDVAENFDGANSIEELARSIAKIAAQKAGMGSDLTLGITLAGLMTIVQAGYQAFKDSEGKIYLSGDFAKKSPDQIVRQRAKDDSQGIFGFLRTVDKQYSVIFDESNKDKGRFKAYLNEEITSAAARCSVKTDERCLEGPIPVECKSAACGNCWVGILGGQEKLTEVQRLERKRMKFFGYNQPDEPKPLLRLACQAKVQGNVTIVIPPWNGIFGKEVYGIEEEKLEGVTTSARRNREIIREVVRNNLT